MGDRGGGVRERESELELEGESAPFHLWKKKNKKKELMTGVSFTPVYQNIGISHRFRRLHEQI